LSHRNFPSPLVGEQAVRDKGQSCVKISITAHTAHNGRGEPLFGPFSYGWMRLWRILRCMSGDSSGAVIRRYCERATLNNVVTSCRFPIVPPVKTSIAHSLGVPFNVPNFPSSLTSRRRGVESIRPL